MARNLVVFEDEAPIREMVCFVLEQNGFASLSKRKNYDSAVTLRTRPDLITWTGCCRAVSGLQFIKLLKREAMTRDIPVVMLTARGEEEEDRVCGLETGADDTSPSHTRKRLVARIWVVMRTNFRWRW